MAHPCERVLVVDDDADTREAIAMLLESEGIEVVAADASDALEVMREGFRPDVVVLDLVMPKVSGRAFRARMKLDPALRDIPVVLCTASPQLAREDDGFAALIAKPFDADAFFAALAELCLDAPKRHAS
jgi:CheY-like chemotaxis protein